CLGWALAAGCSGVDQIEHGVPQRPPRPGRGSGHDGVGGDLQLCIVDVEICVAGVIGVCWVGGGVVVVLVFGRVVVGVLGVPPGRGVELGVGGAADQVGHVVEVVVAEHGRHQVPLQLIVEGDGELPGQRFSAQ